MKKLLLSLFLIPSIGLTEVKVENFTFERTDSTDITYIIISTDRPANVKCAIYDKKDKPVRVSEGLITPPIGEIEMLSKNAMITSVECWGNPVLQNLDEFAEMYSDEILTLIQDSVDYDDFQAQLNSWLIELGIQNLSTYDEINYARVLNIAESHYKNQADIELEKAAEQMELIDEMIKSIEEDDKLNAIRASYISNIASRVKSYWRYQGAEDDWTCEVYIVQDRDGTVVAVDVRNCNNDDSPKAKSFQSSVERAVYKASPLPSAPDEAVFDKELVIKFSVN